MTKNVRTFQFAVEVPGDVISTDGPKPIFSSNNDLVGAFNVISDSVVQAFVSGNEYPESLKVSTGDPFYFTPRDNDFDGKVVYAMLTEIALDDTSILVRALETKR